MLGRPVSGLIRALCLYWYLCAQSTCPGSCKSNVFVMVFVCSVDLSWVMYIRAFVNVLLSTVIYIIFNWNYILHLIFQP